MEILNSQLMRASRYTSKRINLLDPLQKQLISDYQRHYNPSLQTFDYRAFSKSEGFQVLKLILSGLEAFDLNQFSSEEQKKSFWLNVYNMLSIHLVIELEIEDSIKNHRGFFTRYGYRVCGLEFCLDDIEHGILRANSKAWSKIQKPFGSNDPRLHLVCTRLDPRIHFGLYSANVSSPTLQLYVARHLDNQLNLATIKYLQQHFRFDAASGHMILPKLFRWYSQDFGSSSDLIDFITAHVANTKLAGAIGSQRQNIQIEFSDFDWSLNQQRL